MLDVAVDDLLVVREREGAEDGEEDLPHVGGAERALRVEHVPEGAPP